MTGLAISNLAWEKDQDKNIINILKKAGSDIEIAPTKIWEQPTQISTKTAKNYKKYWEDAGIKIVALQSLLYGHPELQIFTTPKTRKKTLEFLKKIIKLASVLGAKNLIFGSPKNRDKLNLTKKEVEEISLSFFTSVANTASDYDVNFCLEPNPIEYHCNFLTSAQEGLEFVERIDNKRLRLNLDTACMTLAKDDPVKLIREAKKYLKHFHVSEPFLGLLGSNKVNHKLFSNALGNIDYNGYVSIEMLTKNSENNLLQIEKSIKFVNKIYINSN